MNEKIVERHQRWLDTISDPELQAGLQEISKDDEVKSDAFYRYLSFGTSGMRGVIGAGTNRMNIYTVGRAAQGQANYYLKNAPDDQKEISVVISYDSRINSQLFAEYSASIFAGNGLKVYIFKELTPVPTLSFAVRELKADSGVMITASHNPAKYNGYKVYMADGCQANTEVSEGIAEEFEPLNLFEDIKIMDFNEGIQSGQISYVADEILDKYIEHIMNESYVDANTDIDKDVKIIYSPLNGTGLVPVTRALECMGYDNITLVEEQTHPDGNFPTCRYPNPEVKETMALGVEYAKREDADLFMATDPDADRVGIAVKDASGEFQLLSANITGALILDYICHRLTAMNKMPDNPVYVKTIVTTSLGENIATANGLETINVLTGFKYIGKQIGVLEDEGRIDDFIFGHEESYGYLTGTYVRDKDAVSAAVLIAEMFAYYKTRGISLFDRLDEIYDEYGYVLDTLESYTFEGRSGAEKMQVIMHNVRQPVESFAGIPVTEIIDYSEGIGDLPKSDVIEFDLGDNGHVIVRPSGTEPKIKIYLSLRTDRDKAEELEEAIRAAVLELAGI